MDTREPADRLIIHVDMDCFYVSVERLLDPSLEGKPVAAGGSAEGRGVVASASYEARAFGVRSAMPMGQALRLCPQLIVVSRGFSQYAEYSHRIHDLLLEFTPLVQMASQDEAYLDLSGTERLWGPPLAAARLIRERIASGTKLPCSLGIGTNKLVAKIASGLCKPRGMLYIPAGSEEAFLRPLGIRRLPGLGPKLQARLTEAGVKTLGEIGRMDRARLKRLFGEHGEDFAARARGHSSSPVVVDESAKSMSAEETFTQDTVDRLFLEEILSNLCEKVAYRLRKAGYRASTITLKYRYHDFETHTASRTLPSAIDDEGEMLAAVREMLFAQGRLSRPIRLIGVAGSGLISDAHQGDLFETESHERLDRLHNAVDSLRSKHGYGSIRRGSSGGRAEESNEKRWG